MKIACVSSRMQAFNNSLTDSDDVQMVIFMQV